MCPKSNDVCNKKEPLVGIGDFFYCWILVVLTG